MKLILPDKPFKYFFTLISRKKYIVLYCSIWHKWYQIIHIHPFVTCGFRSYMFLRFVLVDTCWFMILTSGYYSIEWINYVSLSHSSIDVHWGCSWFVTINTFIVNIFVYVPWIWERKRKQQEEKESRREVWREKENRIFKD